MFMMASIHHFVFTDLFKIGNVVHTADKGGERLKRLKTDVLGNTQLI